jgi:hypothetical protein
MAESWAMTKGQVLYKDIAQINLPAIIVVGQNFWNVEFFDDVLSKYYALGATVEGLELYIRVRPHVRVRP